MMKNNNGLRAILAAVVSIGILLLMLWLAPMLVSNGEKQTQLQSSQADIQKADILKKVGEKKKQLDRARNGLQKRIAKIKEDAEADIAAFDQQFDINPILLVNIVLKF